MDIFSFITNHISEIGVLGLGIWFTYEKFVSGSNALSTKIIEDYKTRNGQLEEQIKLEKESFESFKSEMHKIISDYKSEIIKLQTSNLEKDEHNKTLKDLLLDKNPEVISVLKDIRSFLEASSKSNNQVLEYQTEILEEIKERSDKIEIASKAHRGEPMLVPTNGH